MVLVCSARIFSVTSSSGCPSTGASMLSVGREEGISGLRSNPTRKEKKKKKEARQQTERKILVELHAHTLESLDGNGQRVEVGAAVRQQLANGLENQPPKLQQLVHGLHLQQQGRQKRKWSGGARRVNWWSQHDTYETGATETDEQTNLLLGDCCLDLGQGRVVHLEPQRHNIRQDVLRDLSRRRGMVFGVLA